jgi:penicillin-binding protein 1A
VHNNAAGAAHDASEQASQDKPAETTLSDLFPNLLHGDLSAQQFAVLAESYRPDANAAPGLFADITTAPRIITEQIAYLVQDAMRDVIRRGTGVRANRALRRSDLSGKTGTSNDGRDAWFAGFNNKVVAIVWVGYDDHTPLGPREEGSRTALPIWIEFMRSIISGTPLSQMEMPKGITTVRINKLTGCNVTAADPLEDRIFEVFRDENVPDCDTAGAEPDIFNSYDDPPEVLEELPEDNDEEGDDEEGEDEDPLF